MNIRQVKGFFKLAQTLNFSRAAEQMYMSQPAFSRMIDSLETELGAKLIERGKARPRLTEAGEAVLPNMKRILTEYSEITEKIHRLGSKDGVLTIGILEEGLHGRRAELLRGFAAENPSIEIDFVELTESTAFDAVFEMEVDCAFVAHFPGAVHHRLSAEKMGTSPKCAVMNRSNPLAKNRTLQTEDLRDEPFVMISESRSRYGNFDTVATCMRSGFTPHIVKEAASLSTAMSEVEMNSGIMILSDDLASVAPDDIVFIPLEDEEPCSMWCVHSADSSSSFMKKFSEYIAKNVSQDD
jgi:DNA-binding transcriptional LysR family regulator